MSLPAPRKRPRTEEAARGPGLNATAPTGSRSSEERTAAEQGHRMSPGGTAAPTPTPTGADPSSRPSGSFFRVDPPARLALVQDIVKSWDLSATGASDPPPVSAEEIGMAEAFARGVKAVAECRRLEGTVNRYQRRCERLQSELASCEATQKEMQQKLEQAAADTAKAQERGYQQGHSDTLTYLRKVLLTLAGEFHDDRYFEAYLKYVDDRERAIAEGRDPDEVEFVAPSEGEATADEPTHPLEVAGLSDEEPADDNEPDA